MSETVNHPAHYGGGEDPYEHQKVVRAWNLNYFLGNATKYICRAGKKPGVDDVEDLQKAAWYLAAEITHRLVSRDGAVPIAVNDNPTTELTEKVEGLKHALVEVTVLLERTEIERNQLQKLLLATPKKLTRRRR